jgi:putative membrane-bound dehydrogenase-like protein
MKSQRLRLLPLLATLLALIPWPTSAADAPLRIFIRSGPKSHGPGAHDHPAFLRDWVPLLNARGAKATGADRAPTAEELLNTDVLVIHRDGGGDFSAAEKQALLDFTGRGGGLVVVHAGCVSNTPEGTDFYKQLIGGSWRRGTTKWLEGPMHLYFTDRANPITKDFSNFAMDDEIYYDMDLEPSVRILAGAYTPKPAGARNDTAAKRAEELTSGGKKVSVYDIQPQIWTYSKDNYRAFVSIPGHYYLNFNRPNFRALLLRGIAWAGKRENLDELCKADELGDHLRYVDGGPTRPEKAHEKIEVHPDFNLSLVASEPLVNKVMNVDWDAKGRLWVCETPEYPNGRRSQNSDPWKDAGSLYPGSFEREPQDKISWLEDTNGDGVMDKKHVFADQLELVTSFVFHKNGVIACAAPDIWLLEDTQGKGVCDKRTKLYTGLGSGDTHAVINNLRWGLDGWIYASHGYSTSPKVTNGDGSRNFGGYTAGVIRFKPDGSAFEQYSSKNGNVWGLQMTWDGQCFFTQPTSGEVLMHVALPEPILAQGKLPRTNSYNVLIKGQRTFPLLQWKEQAYVQIDQVGYYTAAAGCALYEGGAWPTPWNYSYFTTEPTINIVSHFNVSPEGVSYKAEKEKGREETEFIRGSDPWFRPIETRIGPDGALYVVDFYNQAVIHNDTRGPQHGPANAAIRPDRDHYFSRIWKVQHKQARKLEVPSLEPSNLPQLLDTVHHHPNAQTKWSALRLIRENHSPDRVAEALNLPSGSRAEAVYRAATLQASTPAGRAELLRSFAAGADVWTQSALVAAAADHRLEVLAAALQSKEPEKLAPLATALVSNLLNRAPAEAGPLLVLAAKAPPSSAPVRDAMLSAISLSQAPIEILNADALQAIRTLLSNPETAGNALPLVARSGKASALSAAMAEVVESLLVTLRNSALEPQLRAKAASNLLPVATLNASVLPAIEQIITSQNPEPLKAALLDALGDCSEPEAGRVLLASYRALPPQLKAAAFNQLLKRPEWARGLLTALQKGEIPPDDLGPANLARLRTHPNKSVAQAAEKILAQTGNASTTEKNKLLATLTPRVEEAGGDIEKGKALFTSACAVCHQLGSLGAEVGPSLNGMGAHAPADLLVAIIDPNREVDPSFVAWNITKKNGETLAGVIAQENSSILQIRSPAGLAEISKEQIASRENTKRSLMPEGFEAFGPENLRNLIAFIRSTESRFRVVNLASAFTADTRGGLFKSEHDTRDTLAFKKFGTLNVNGIPFTVVDPQKSTTGANIIVLKGGPNKNVFSKSLPQHVEIPFQAEVAKLHLLSGVGGWAGGGFQPKGTVVLTVTAVFADGRTEEFRLKDGEHFADYNGNVAVPGSQEAPGLLAHGQVRVISLPLKKPGQLRSIRLESSDSVAAPVVAAITGDNGSSH